LVPTPKRSAKTRHLIHPNQTRFDKSAWTGGADLVIGNLDKVSVDLGYRAEVGKSVTSHDVHFTLNARF